MTALGPELTVKLQEGPFCIIDYGNAAEGICLCRNRGVSSVHTCALRTVTPRRASLKPSSLARTRVTSGTPGLSTCARIVGTFTWPIRASYVNMSLICDSKCDRGLWGLASTSPRQAQPPSESARLRPHASVTITEVGLIREPSYNQPRRQRPHIRGGAISSMQRRTRAGS